MYTKLKTISNKKSNTWKSFLFLATLMLISLAVSSFFYTKFIHQTQTNILGSTSSISESEVLSLINLERAKLDIKSLTHNPQLQLAAELKIDHMISNEYFAHKTESVNPWDFISQSEYTYQSAGENLGRNFHNSQELVQAWMDSPPHRNNILNPSYVHTGLAIYEGESDSIMVHMFASPLVVSDTSNIDSFLSAGFVQSQFNFFNYLQIFQVLIAFILIFIILMYIYLKIHSKLHKQPISHHHWKN